MTKVSSSDIIKIATKFKNYTEKNGEIPPFVKINGVKYSYKTCIYLFSGFINHPKKSIKARKPKKAVNPHGDSIKEKVLLNDYKNMADRVVKYIRENKVLPSFCKTTKSKKKVMIYLCAYAFSKIVVGYGEKKVFPDYCVFNSNDVKLKTKLYSYLTNTGCSGMGQCTGYNCGPNSLQQCFYRLTGILVSESTIASWAGTTSSGTDHDGLATAVHMFNSKYNQSISLKWANFSDLGNSDSERWNTLESYIKKGAVFVHLLYRDKWGHYEVPKDVSTSTCKILNSLGDSCGSGTYCGYIESRARSTQLRYMKGISQKSLAILTRG